jgi:hypothetical protein
MAIGTVERRGPGIFVEPAVIRPGDREDGCHILNELIDVLTRLNMGKIPTEEFEVDLIGPAAIDWGLEWPNSNMVSHIELQTILYPVRSWTS